jgi:hypothetical protein
VEAGCNLCGSRESHHLFTKNRWRLEICDGCGLVRVDPMPSREQIAQMYAPTAGYQRAQIEGPARWVARLFAAAGFEPVRFLPDEIPLWYTSGFLGEPQPRHWLRGEPGAWGARAIYLTTLPVFLAARLFGHGDSMIVCGTRC